MYLATAGEIVAVAKGNINAISVIIMGLVEDIKVAEKHQKI